MPSLLYQIPTKHQKGYQETHKSLSGQVIASTTNQEGFTYDDNDDDVHNIDMMDTYKK
jgi:hypothetical protein